MSLPASWTSNQLPPGDYVIGLDMGSADTQEQVYVYFDGFRYIVIDSYSAFYSPQPPTIDLEPWEYSRDTKGETASRLAPQFLPRPRHHDEGEPQPDDSVAFYFYRNKAVSSFDARAVAQASELPPVQDRPRWLTLALQRGTPIRRSQ